MRHSVIPFKTVQYILGYISLQKSLVTQTEIDLHCTYIPRFQYWKEKFYENISPLDEGVVRSKLALESLCHRISNFAKTKLLVLFTSGWLSQWWKIWLGFKVKLCKYSATAFRHHLLLFPAPGNPPGPWFAFSTPLSALHWLITNPCLSFHLITLV